MKNENINKKRKPRPQVKKAGKGNGCPLYKKCGGCQYQGMPYPEQLKKKQRQEEELLKKFGKVNKIIGMEHPYYYRNKVHSAFGRDRRGSIISGTYQAGTHYIVQVEECLIDLELPRPKDNDLSWRVKDAVTGKWVDCDKPPYVTDVDQKTKGLVNIRE